MFNQLAQAELEAQFAGKHVELEAQLAEKQAELEKAQHEIRSLRQRVSELENDFTASEGPALAAQLLRGAKRLPPENPLEDDRKDPAVAPRRLVSPRSPCEYFIDASTQTNMDLPARVDDDFFSAPSRDGPAPLKTSKRPNTAEATRQSSSAPRGRARPNTAPRIFSLYDCQTIVRSSCSTTHPSGGNTRIARAKRPSTAPGASVTVAHHSRLRNGGTIPDSQGRTPSRPKSANLLNGELVLDAGIQASETHLRPRTPKPLQGNASIKLLQQAIAVKLVKDSGPTEPNLVCTSPGRRPVPTTPGPEQLEEAILSGLNTADHSRIALGSLSDISSIHIAEAKDESKAHIAYEGAAKNVTAALNAVKDSEASGRTFGDEIEDLTNKLESQFEQSRSAKTQFSTLVQNENRVQTAKSSKQTTAKDSKHPHTPASLHRAKPCGGAAGRAVLSVAAQRKKLPSKLGDGGAATCKSCIELTALPQAPEVRFGPFVSINRGHEKQMASKAYETRVPPPSSLGGDLGPAPPPRGLVTRRASPLR